MSEAEDQGGENQCNRKRSGKGHVRGRGVGKADHADGCGKKKEQPTGSPSAVETPSEPSHGEGCEKCGESAGEACSDFAGAEEFEAEGRAPVIKDWLLEPRLAVEARSDPVAGFGHVAGNPGVARLVGANEADGAEIVEVAEVERGEDKGEPEKAHRRGERIAVWGGVVSWSHGSSALRF